MPISTPQLMAASGRVRVAKARSLSEATANRMQTAFLCHSHRDASLAQGLVTLLGESGWSVYVDWEDALMPDTPDRDTAKRIQDKIGTLKYFLFLATENSTSSRWCPWEIGYADGKKPIDDILIIPTVDRSGNFHGNEYLRLYRKIDETTPGTLGVFRVGQTYNGTPLATALAR
jgi:hypothetical protein